MGASAWLAWLVASLAVTGPAAGVAVKSIAAATAENGITEASTLRDYPPSHAVVPAVLVVTPAPKLHLHGGRDAERLLEAVGSHQEEELARAQVQERVIQEEKKGMANLEEIVAEEKHKWVDQANLVTMEAQHTLKKEIDRDLQQVRAQVQASEQKQMAVLNEMNKSIQEAREHAISDAGNTTAAYARAQFQKEAYAVVDPVLLRLHERKDEVEQTRGESYRFAEDVIKASQAAKNISSLAQRLSQLLRGRSPKENAVAMMRGVGASLAQVKHAQLVAQMAIRASKDVLDMTNYTEQEARQAEAKAKQSWWQSKVMEKRLNDLTWKAWRAREKALLKGELVSFAKGQAPRRHSHNLRKLR
eukprot:TRINITY_DN15210_c0_g1_i1.p1 TRINITY_DN15210_c0_g1~~TRINITY_DN15210_c0_g1_i1.p1  ORF type:complete len:368 (+),score=77.92 TRINITY_DN15210_c0_g1_i1:26-1105(+)